MNDSVKDTGTTEDGSVPSKADDQVAADRSCGTPAAMKAKAPRLEPGASRGQALSESVGLAARQIVANWDAFAAGGDEETVHQMRVALRRMRVAVKAFRLEEIDPALASLGDEAKALGVTVGTLRDLDVLATDIIAPLETVAERPDLAPLVGVLAGLRREARDRLVEALGEPRWTAYKSTLALWPHQLEPHKDAESFGRSARKAGFKSLKRLWKRIEEAAEDVDTLGIERRHELRKDLRRLRYAVELIAPLADGADAGRLITEIRRLQYSLGHLNDVATAHRLVELPVIRDHVDASVQRAAGFVVGWHAAKAEDSWRETKDALARLERMPRFWE